MSESGVPHAPRCWAEGDWDTGTVELSDAERRHVQKVRRVRAGEEICLLNGKGRMGSGVLTEEGSVEVQSVQQTPAPVPELVLFMAGIKQSAWEEVLRHATELGVARIVRVETDHSVSKVEGKAEKKLTRWRELLIEACKQSANAWLPDLVLTSSVADALSLDQGPDVQWVAQLDGSTRYPGEVLQEGFPETLGVWVGPEGDFSLAELKLLRERGAVPIGLGPRVLRAETAALALLSRLRLHSF